MAETERLASLILAGASSPRAAFEIAGQFMAAEHARSQGLEEALKAVSELVGEDCDCDDYGPCVACTIKPFLSTAPGAVEEPSTDGKKGG